MAVNAVQKSFKRLALLVVLKCKAMEEKISWKPVANKFCPHTLKSRNCRETPPINHLRWVDREGTEQANNSIPSCDDQKRKQPKDKTYMYPKHAVENVASIAV